MPWKSKEQERIYNAKWRQRRREEAKKIFGEECVICHSKRSLVLHNILGEEHSDTCTASIALREPWKWRRLCYRCHKGIHFCMEFFGWTWEIIVEHIQPLKKNPMEIALRIMKDDVNILKGLNNGKKKTI